LRRNPVRNPSDSALVPRRSDFDSEPGHYDKHAGSTNTSMLRATFGCLDEPCGFERRNHLVNGRWADAEILLNVGFGRMSAMQARPPADRAR
jgi:hypothetical protein